MRKNLQSFYYLCPINLRILKIFKLIIFVFSLLLSACTVTKFVPQKQYLLDRVEIKSDQRGFDAASLAPYIHQKPNSKWFSMFRIPLAVYSVSGRDTSRWINRRLQKIGEKPVIFDTLQARLSCQDLRTALQNLGYMHASVAFNAKVHGKKLHAIYTLHPDEPFYIGAVNYDIQDDSIARLMNNSYKMGLRAGMPFTVNTLNEERKRLTEFLQNHGYFKFHKDFIQYTADSIKGSNKVQIGLHLYKYRSSTDSAENFHPRYKIGQVNFLSGDSDRIHLRRHVLEVNTDIKPSNEYRARDLQSTYNNFSRLQAVRYTNIRFVEHPDTNLLDCNIQISTNKPSTISFQPEGTNTAGDLGAAASLTYTNRNLFRGSEQFSVALRGAFEAITRLEGYSDRNYQEYSIETKLTFPQFVAPFLSTTFRHRQMATSELAVSWNFQNRPEFYRRVFSTAWRYRWSEPRRHLNYRFDLLDLNYVYMPWISETFKHDYLDSVSNRNAILRYNYEDLFIMKIGFGLTYSDGVNAFRANVETAGNLLNAVAKSFHFRQNAIGQNTFLNIAYAQYAKFDFYYTRLLQFDLRNALAMHMGFGLAYPYGNSTVLPFEKRYFSGGANSVRGWGVRELGPGSYRGTDGRIDFINHTGDLKLDMNIEYRTSLFWKLHGAAFVDAGNIWTLRDYANQPGGKFYLKDFYKQIAVAYGLGLRLNFDYFILRLDMGMKAVNPAYTDKDSHYPFLHPRLKRDLNLHFAVGLPF